MWSCWTSAGSSDAQSLLPRGVRFGFFSLPTQNKLNVAPRWSYFIDDLQWMNRCASLSHYRTQVTQEVANHSQQQLINQEFRQFSPLSKWTCSEASPRKAFDHAVSPPQRISSNSQMVNRTQLEASNGHGCFGGARFFWNWHDHVPSSAPGQLYFQVKP